MKFRNISILAAMSLALAATPALADDHPEDFAQYGVSLGGSPFGGSASFIYNVNKKTSYLFTFGGAAGGSLDLEIGGNDYTVKSSSAWTGVFLNHRPIDSAEWFRLVAGLGVGSIENELEGESGKVFQADYNENPVGYSGLGFGFDTSKGFQWGVDIGLLFTSGSEVRQVAGDVDVAATEDIADFFLFGNVLPNFQLTLGWGF